MDGVTAAGLQPGATWKGARQLQRGASDVIESDCEKLLVGGDGEICGERVGGGFFVPEDAEDVPAGAVVEELNAVDAAGEGFFGGGVAGFVAAEDLRDIAEFINVIDDGGFEEAVFGEVAAGAFDVVVDGEEADGR